jgi:hypothetical protein
VGHPGSPRGDRQGVGKEFGAAVRVGSRVRRGRCGGGAGAAAPYRSSLRRRPRVPPPPRQQLFEHATEFRPTQAPRRARSHVSAPKVSVPNLSVPSLSMPRPIVIL